MVRGTHRWAAEERPLLDPRPGAQRSHLRPLPVAVQASSGSAQGLPPPPEATLPVTGQPRGCR